MPVSDEFFILSEHGFDYRLDGIGLNDPRFGEATRITDWRTQVGERTSRLWATFTPEQRVAIALDAEERAAVEEEDWS